MDRIKMFNLSVRFLLEIALIVIFGYWGFKTGSSTLMKIVLGIGAPILFAVVWGAFLAPKSSLRLHEPWLFLLEIFVIGLAAWSLYQTSRTLMPITFVIIYMINKMLLVIWKQ
jgi:hypothetical protein